MIKCLDRPDHVEAWIDGLGYAKVTHRDNYPINGRHVTWYFEWTIPSRMLLPETGLVYYGGFWPSRPIDEFKLEDRQGYAFTVLVIRYSIKLEHGAT